MTRNQKLELSREIRQWVAIAANAVLSIPAIYVAGKVMIESDTWQSAKNKTKSVKDKVKNKFHKEN